MGDSGEQVVAADHGAAHAPVVDLAVRLIDAETARWRQTASPSEPSRKAADGLRDL
jgi:hypothetical protein